MKIICWNCQKGLTKKKANFLKSTKADILIILKDKEKTPLGEYRKIFHNAKNSSLGIGVYVLNEEYGVEPIEDHPEDIEVFLPFKVIWGKFEFNILAVWAKMTLVNKKSGELTAIKGIEHYHDKYLTKLSTWVIGDFSYGYYDKNFDKLYPVEKFIQMINRNLLNISGEIAKPNYKTNSGKYLKTSYVLSPQVEVQSTKVKQHHKISEFCLSNHLPLFIQIILKKKFRIMVNDLREEEDSLQK